MLLQEIPNQKANRCIKDCVSNNFKRINSCNKHDKLKFNPEFVEMAVTERGNFAELWSTVRATLPDVNSHWKYLESRASEAVT